MGHAYPDTKATCADRVADHWNNRRGDLREFRDAGPGTDFTNPEGYEFYEYALCFDYVDQIGKAPGYWRYQMSTGGPQEEIRYYATKDIPSDGYLGDMTCVEFWLLDWFDGAPAELVGDDLELALWVFQMHNAV